MPEGGSFDDIAALKYKKNIGEGINIIIGKLAEENDLKGIIDIADFLARNRVPTNFPAL